VHGRARLLEVARAAVANQHASDARTESQYALGDSTNVEVADLDRLPNAALSTLSTVA